MNGWDIGQPINPMMGMMEQPRINYQNTFNYLPRYKVINVKGEAGARNFRMAPDSSALLLDETAPIVWLVQTDGSGLLTPTPFDIVLHKEEPQVNVEDLAARVTQLEEYINNVKSNSFSTKQSKKQHKSTEQSISGTTAD